MQIKVGVAIFVCLGIVYLPVAAFAQEAERPALSVVTIKDGSQPTLDGKVDDEAWNSAVPYSTFTQQEPDEGQPASERTELRFLADRGRS